MEQRLETFSAPIVIQDIEDTSNKKSKKKKKKHDKEGGEHHKHKKSKHKKEKRSSDGSKNDESSIAQAGLPAPASFQPGMPVLDGSTCVSQYNSHPTHQWPPNSVAPPSISTYEGSTNQMISNPCTPLVSPGTANVQRASIANPVVLNTQTSVTSVNTPPLSPGNFLHLRHINPDTGSHNGNSTAYQGADRFPQPSRFPPSQPMERMELPPTVRGMPPPPGAFLAAANSRFPLGPPPGIGNLPLIPPERFLTPPPSLDGSVPNPPLNPAMYQRPPPPAGFTQPPPQQPGNRFQGNGSFRHGMPPTSGAFPARPPMPEDFLPLHEFPPPKPGGAGNPAAYQQHPDQTRMVVDYQTNQHIINNALALPQKFDTNTSLTDINHNQNDGRMPLGSADYTKIVQALETLKSSNIIASTPPPIEKVEHELETEPVSPPREDKDRKSKKHKRHKKEKKKESKKKLEEKLADVANMNDEERNALLEELNNKEKDKKESKKEKMKEKEQRTKDPEWDWSKENKEEKDEEPKSSEGLATIQVVSDDASGNEKIPQLEAGIIAEADKTAALTVDTSAPPVSSIGSSQPALSIQFNPKSSKFNLKIGSPVMKGNIFQKYKARTEAPSFNKHADQADRKYRKNTGKEGDAVQVDDDDDEDDDDENDPKTKEQLLKMLGIDVPAPVIKKEEEVTESAPPGVDADDDKEIYSGSEEGEVVSDEEEMEERKRLKEIIKQAKVEALKSETNSPPSRTDEALSPDDAPNEDAAVTTSEQKDASGEAGDGVGVVTEGVKDISDGEISTDGEVSSDGELSDDSVDEFGRSKKLRGSMPINSPSDSSESEDGGARWDPTTKKSPSRTDGNASDRSRSHSPSPVRSVSPVVQTEKSTEQPSKEPTDDNKDVVSDPAPVAEETHDKEKENAEKEKNAEKDRIKVEEEKAAIEKERLRLEVEQREAAEKERLRLEVEKLESTIDEEVVSKIKHIPNDGSESSATDISDDEDVPNSEGIVITPNGPQSALQSARQSKAGSPVHENSAAENLRREMMEMINKKEKEKEGIETNAVLPTAEDKANGEVLEKDGSEEKKKEDIEEQKGDDYIDIFADSDTELRKENSDLEAEVEMEQEKITAINQEEKMETDTTDVQESVVEKAGEEPINEEEVCMDVQDSAGIESVDKEKASPSSEGVEKPEDESKKEDQEDYEDTLKSLSEIRNNMSSMSKEELEEALAKLPSITHETVCEDGRVTPLHLRDIMVPVQSLTEYVEDKKALYKQVFKNINKKEFKFMLPKYLRKFDVKTVRNWCLDEMEIMSKKRLRAIILRQFLASSSSESEEEEEEEEEEKPVQVKKESKKVTKEKKEKDGSQAEEEKPKKKSKKEIKKEKRKEKKGKKDKSKKKKAKEEKEGNKEDDTALPSIVKIERVDVSDEAAGEPVAMDEDRAEKGGSEEVDRVGASSEAIEDKSKEGDGGSEKSPEEFIVKIKQEKVDKPADDRVKVKEEKGRRPGKGGKSKADDLSASEIIRIKKEVQSAEEDEGEKETEEAEKAAEQPIMKIKQEKAEASSKKSESPAKPAVPAAEPKRREQKGYGHVPEGPVKIKIEPSDNGAFDKAAGVKVEPTADREATPDKNKTVAPPPIEEPKDPIKIKQEKQDKQFVADFTVIDETKCTSTKKSETDKSKKDTSQDDSSSDSDSDDSKDSKSDTDGSDSNENKSDSNENKSDSDNKSKSGESGDNKSGSDSDSDSGSDSSESENKSSSDSDADDVNISSDDVRRAMQSTSDDDDDDDEEAKEDSSANDSDDESSDTESKPRKAKAKRKEGQVEVKREPKSSSGSDNSSSEGEDESSAKEKTKKKDMKQIEQKAKEEVRRRRPDLSSEREAVAPESYRADKEKHRAEKEKLLRQQQMKDDSDPDSDADYEEEVNERRHRLARYYREKERLKQEKSQQPEEGSQRKVVRVKRGGSANEERVGADHEESDDSNNDERGRFKSEMNEVSMSIERNNQEHEQFMKYMSLKRKRDQEKTDLRRKLEGNKGGNNSGNADNETLIIRKNQFANRRQVHVNDQAPSQGGGPPLRPPQPPTQPGQHLSSNPPNTNQREKPEGYDERRRQREMEKRKMEAGASGGGGARGRDTRGRDGDHRAGGMKDNYGDKNYNEKDNYANERTNYPDRGNYDKSDSQDRGTYNEKGNYQNKGNYQGGNYNDTTYNPRGRQRTRSVQGHDQGGAHDKKVSRDSSEAFARDTSMNRKQQRGTSREQSREQRGTSREQRETSRDKAARDLPKRKAGHSSSEDESGNKSGRKRKRRGGAAAGGAGGNPEGGAGASGGGGAAGGADAKPASHLRELEFRARALQSLLNKKEESNKQTARRRGR